MPVTGTTAGESCCQGMMENNARHAGCAAGLIHACQFISLLQEIRLLTCSPRISPQCPRGFICPHALVKRSTQRGRTAPRFLPRGMRDLEQPGKAPSCPHSTPSRALPRRRWPGTMPGSCSLSASAGQIRTGCRGTVLLPPPACTRGVCLKGEFAALSHSGVRNGRGTFSASAFHFLIVSAHADSPTCQQVPHAWEFPFLAQKTREGKNSL